MLNNMNLISLKAIKYNDIESGVGKIIIEKVHGDIRIGCTMKICLSVSNITSNVRNVAIDIFIDEYLKIK